MDGAANSEGIQFVATSAWLRRWAPPLLPLAPWTSAEIHHFDPDKRAIVHPAVDLARG